MNRICCRVLCRELNLSVHVIITDWQMQGDRSFYCFFLFPPSRSFIDEWVYKNQIPPHQAFCLRPGMQCSLKEGEPGFHLGQCHLPAPISEMLFQCFQELLSKPVELISTALPFAGGWRAFKDCHQFFPTANN